LSCFTVTHASVGSPHKTYTFPFFIFFHVYIQMYIQNKKKVRMNLTEGLQCGFLQQAVVIDPDEGQYIPLGEIKKSLTITPDIDKAFSS